MDRPFVMENDEQRKRLQMLVDGITDDELRLGMGAGWTVAAAFAHLAFWDQRVLVFMKKWKKTGVAPSPIDDDVTNDAILPLCLAIPPRTAAALALASAEAVDRELAEASDDFITEIEKLGDRFRLYRCDHRKVHLDEVISLLHARRINL
jgi:hypothetical protein